MQPADYHRVLYDQIREALGDAPQIPPAFQKLLSRVGATYLQLHEENRRLVEGVRLRTEQLIASTSRAYSFLDSLHMGFIMCDINGEVVLTNDALRHILELQATAGAVEPDTAAVWTIDSIGKRIHPQMELKKLVLQCLSLREPRELKEVAFGNRTLHMFFAPMGNEVAPGKTEQIGAVILVEDITEQKDLERSKDEFLSIASHELRTPLTAIRGNTFLIKKYYADRLPDKDVTEMIDDIHESAVRLIDIVNDFLDVSALEQKKMSMDAAPFAIKEVADDAVRELQALCASKGITLQKDASMDAAPNVMADKQRVKQVVYNLVGNAVKFTDEGSITLSARADDRLVYVIVTDTGRGIPPESQRLLFRKFQQAGGNLLTRDTTKGTGLGLYISKLIVEQSGGKITLEHSEAGKGSAFMFSLPRANVAAH